MADQPQRRKPGKTRANGRPEIWASGSQRPAFSLKALGQASLFLARDGVAPLLAWSARRLRRLAVGVRDGKGRIPAGKLGRAERFLPSHLRVAAWVRNLAAALSHASANADPDVRRGNALVAEIAPPLWEVEAPAPAPAPEARPEPMPAAPDPVGPVVLQEPAPQKDPLAAIRGELATGTAAEPNRRTAEGQSAVPPSGPPGPPGPVAEAVIQVSGYLVGWGSAILALPYGLVRALWLWGARGRDLRTIARED